jgi:3-oxoadipate enol-lactonase
MSRRPSAQQRLVEELVRGALPWSSHLARAPWIPGAVDAGIRIERAVRGNDAHEAHAHVSGDGPPLLLVNGWTASGTMWPRSLVDDLSRDHRVIRVDNRGTGFARGAPAPFRIADLADDAAAALARHDRRPATVVGVSMGGMIAQELALRHPDRVRGLVLVATRPPAPAHIQARPAVLRAVLEVPRAGDASAMWAALCAEGFVESNPAAVDELVSQVLERVTPRAAVFAQMRAIAAWGGPHRLRAIRCPTTVVHGGADRLMPVGNGMRLARMIRGARYVEIAGVGHLVPMEAPQPLLDAIRST